MKNANEYLKENLNPELDLTKKIEFIKKNFSDCEIARWAYSVSVQGMADGVVQFNFTNNKFETAYYTTGSWDARNDVIEICRISQNNDANSNFDIIADAVGHDFNVMLNWADEYYKHFENENNNDFLRRIYCENKTEFDKKLIELSGQDVEKWQYDYETEDFIIDWEEVEEQLRMLDERN